MYTEGKTEEGYCADIYLQGYMFALYPSSVFSSGENKISLCTTSESPEVSISVAKCLERRKDCLLFTVEGISWSKNKGAKLEPRPLYRKAPLTAVLYNAELLLTAALCILEPLLTAPLNMTGPSNRCPLIGAPSDCFSRILEPLSNAAHWLLPSNWSPSWQLPCLYWSPFWPLPSLLDSLLSLFSIMTIFLNLTVTWDSYILWTKKIWKFNEIFNKKFDLFV